MLACLHACMLRRDRFASRCACLSACVNVKTVHAPTHVCCCMRVHMNVGEVEVVAAVVGVVAVAYEVT